MHADEHTHMHEHAYACTHTHTLCVSLHNTPFSIWSENLKNATKQFIMVLVFYYILLTMDCKTIQIPFYFGVPKH